MIDQVRIKEVATQALLCVLLVAVSIDTFVAIVSFVESDYITGLVFTAFGVAAYYFYTTIKDEPDNSDLLKVPEKVKA